MRVEDRNTKPKNGFRKYVLLGSVAAVMQMGGAHAQSPATTEDTANVEEETRRENVVIVTATKRERSLQDVPISVTALSVDALDDAAVTNIESLQFSVPGLSMTTSSGTGFQSSIRIRGVGTSGTNLGFEGAVGIFVDGVYRPRAGTSLGDFADVERIEVLRGPQGTLFGRNTTAGAISVVTKKPVLDELSGSLRATFGNFSRQQYRGILNVPLAEGKAAARFSADFNQRDGFLENIFPGGADVNDRDRMNLRGQLLFEPNPDMELRLIGTYFTADESCCGAVLVNDGAFVPLANAGALAPFGITGPASSDADQREDFLTARNRATKEDQEETGIQADFEWDLGGGITFFNSLSYSDYEVSGFQDSDQTGIDFNFTEPNDVTQTQFTEEFRFSGVMNDLSFAQSLNWLAGGYYSDEELGQDYRLTFTQDAAAINTLLTGAPGFPPFGFTPGDTHGAVLGQETQTIAIFGHVDADINDQVNISGGLRYTEEDKTGTGAFDTVNLGPINPFIAVGASDFEADADADEWIGTIALNYKFTDDISVYGSAAHGYKSGGVNLDVLGGQGGADAGTPRALVANGFASFDAVVADPTFPVEEVDTFELGFRSRLWDGRGTFNVTGFHSTFSNFQVLQFTGTNFAVLSAPEVTTQGFESELQVNPIEGLDIGVQYAYTNAEYSKPFLLDGNQLGGERIDKAPEHSASINATYSAPIPNTNFKGFVNGSWSYDSEFNTSTTLEPTRVQDAYSFVGGRFGIRTNDDKYSLEVWCRNCTDEAVSQIIFASPVVDGSEFGFVHPPQEWGVTLSARF